MTTDFEQIPLGQTEDLVWAMLDEQISDKEFQQLESTLRADEDARRLYIECVQLHVDLQRWYSASENADRPKPVGLPLDPFPSGDASMADPAF